MIRALLNPVRARVQSGLVNGFRFGLGAIFVYSGVSKVIRPYDFLRAVYGYEILGPRSGLLVAILIPWTEFLVGLMLIAGIFLSSAFILGAVMGSSFVWAQYDAIRRGISAECGCFASTSEPQLIDRTTLARAGLVAAIAVVGAVLCIIRDSPLLMKPSSKKAGVNT